MTAPELVPATAFDGASGSGPAALVRRVAAAAAAEDGAAPLDEATLLGLRHGLAGTSLWTVGEGFAWRHDGALDVVVAPDARRQGLGSALASAATAEPGPLTAWSHVDHPGAAALAAGHGFDRVRDLWVMRRSLAGLPEERARPDDGRTSRSAPSRWVATRSPGWR